MLENMQMWLHKVIIQLKILITTLISRTERLPLADKQSMKLFTNESNFLLIASDVPIRLAM